MPVPADAPAEGAQETCQARFHRRWPGLQDAHVRALAWLLDAPDLLDPQAPQWQGRIATLDIDVDAISAWLTLLDRDPAALHAFLSTASVSRLGRYAERLMAFYFGWTGCLVAYGLQVRAAANDTVGEFDFLLREGAALIHYEFATKFYLFDARPSPQAAEYFVGPNLADTLDAKMDKILNRQLALGQHPAAQRCLPQPVARAQALIKGWLFYHGDPAIAPMSPGVSSAHCRGFWCSMAEFCDRLPSRAADEGFLVLPRLAWLAPARVDAGSLLDHASMHQQLQAHFAVQAMPVMLAVMLQEGQQAHEVARGFIVPNDWRERALERHQRAVLRIGGN
ncbi:MAG: DUF1853 family protein [Herminiimonas sp.]|nr:DUF1853 family protein [Herminiimonas sp.]